MCRRGKFPLIPVVIIFGLLAARAQHREWNCDWSWDHTTGAEAASPEKVTPPVGPVVSSERSIDLGPPVVDPAVPRPAWVDASASTSPDGTFVTSLTVGPYATVDECRMQLDEELPGAVNEYIERAVWSEIPQTHWVDVPLDYIYARIARDDPATGTPYVERREHSVGPMYYLHTRLQYDKQVQNELREMKRRAVVGSRLRTTGIGAGFVLALLGAALGFFKLDTATRGSYTKRLLAGTAVVMLGLAAAGSRLLLFQ